MEPRQLEFITYDAWRQQYKSQEAKLNSSLLRLPVRVFATQNEEFGMSPIQKQANYEVLFDYYAPPTDMSAYTSTHTIPTSYEHAIINIAKMYALGLRSDPAFTDRADKMVKETIKQMRIELINKPDFFRAASTIPNTHLTGRWSRGLW